MLSQKWLAVALLFVAGAMNYADRTAVSVVLPLIRKDLSLTDFQLGSMGVVFLWTYALCMPLAGWAGDRFSRSKLIGVSFLAWTLVTFATAYVQDLRQFYATRVLMGIAESFYIPAAIALIAEHHFERSRGIAMSIHLAGINFGLVIGGTVAAYIAQTNGWRAAFLDFGIAGLVFGAITLALLRDAKPTGTITARTRGNGFRELALYPTFFVELAQAMCLAVGVWIFLNWLPLYYSETFGFTLAGSGFAGTFMPQFSSVVGLLIGGWISDRIAKRSLRHRIAAQGLFYLLAAPVLLGFLQRPGFEVASTLVFASSFLRATGQANEDPVLCDVLPNHIRATAIAMMNAGQCLTGGLGVLAAGFLKATFGLQGVFVGIAGLIACAALICWFGFYKTLPRDLAKRELALQREAA